MESLPRYTQTRKYLKSKDKFAVTDSNLKQSIFACIGAQVIFLKTMTHQAASRSAGSKTISKGSLGEITRFDTDSIEILLFSDGCRYKVGDIYFRYVFLGNSPSGRLLQREQSEASDVVT